VMERVNIHVFPLEKFGLILTKNKFFSKIFFANEQYDSKLLPGGY
jgi:hypothetical protein